MLEKTKRQLTGGHAMKQILVSAVFSVLAILLVPSQLRRDEPVPAVPEDTVLWIEDAGPEAHWKEAASEPEAAGLETVRLLDGGTVQLLPMDDYSIPTKFTSARAYTYKGSVSYAQGSQPKDSKGNNVGSPLAAGTVATKEVVVNAVYPYFANTKSAAELTKQPLTTINYIEVSCVSENSQNRHAFALPATYTVTKIEYFDTVANKYNPMATSDFTGVVYSQIVQGNSVQYKKYSRNTQGLSAATKFKITFTKA